jgi:adenine/guanine phosphoribosyltransferase-like PRPP-binding protein
MHSRHIRFGIRAGDKVGIVDDLIATGRYRRFNHPAGEGPRCEDFRICFLIELSDLKGRSRIVDCDVFAIMEFEGE